MAFPKKLKPATIKRLAERRAAERKASRTNLIARLEEKAKAEGPDSIWAEMLTEARKWESV